MKKRIGIVLRKLLPNKDNLTDFVLINFYLIWSIILIVDPSFLLLDVYSGFKFSREVYIGIFLSLFLFSLIGSDECIRSKYLTGFVMMVGSVAWLMTSFSFVLAYPPLNPHMLTFFILAWVCLIRGISTIEEAKKELKNKKGTDIREEIIQELEDKCD
ncbi:Uncharacterised protein [Oligella urethralis]|uniref:hypothetical protein n=1 Tax=Oligella urethralis TaxID=90245 RepID=UPI000E042C82|nr:hypothetical protein [Oligella urethralis]SUA63202.1 Uncharacterised protein [Oligella urethralis]